MKLPAPIRALRPHQWSKNIFVLAAFGFAYGDRSQGASVDMADLPRVLYAVAAFCLGSSAIYLVNDVMDVESDRQHPTKRFRPIAAGEISVSFALVFSVFCAAAALALGYFAGGDSLGVLGIVAAYMAMNLAYSIKLKQILLVDAFCISTGFLFRVQAGGLAAETEVSKWLLLCTLFLTLFLALNKRRAEIALLGEDRANCRAILREYTPGFLDQIVSVLASCTILCYAMYTVDDATTQKFGEGNLMIWTVPFVVFGIGRYLYIVDAHQGGGSPTKILLGGDKPFLIAGILWFLAVAGIVLL